MPLSVLAKRILCSFGCIVIERTEASYANPRRGPMRAQVCPLSSLRIMLWPTVPTTIVTSRMSPTSFFNGWNDLNCLNVLNALNVNPMQILGPRSRRYSGRKDRVEPCQILRAELDFGRLDVLFEVRPRLVARNRNHVLALGHEPRQRQLGRGRVFLASHRFELCQKR